MNFFFSLKWKLSISLVLMSLGFVGVYVLLAKRTFESDKISYIFEAQQRQVTDLARQSAGQIERILSDTRALVSEYDSSRRSFTTSAQTMFWDHPQIMALEVATLDKDSTPSTLSKSQGAVPLTARALPVGEAPMITPLEGERFALTVKLQTKDSSPLRALVIFQLKDGLIDGAEGQTLALATATNIIKLSRNAALPLPILEQWLWGESTAAANATSFQTVANQRHLVSAASVGYGGLRWLSLTSESQALGALGVLYRRSILFVAFSFFASIILSLLLSNRLTQNINSLTESAHRIGQGDFTVTSTVQSNDEVGVLARTFSQMAARIQNLLEQMADKIRMETELQTARLVQESLFPAAASYANGKVRLHGNYKTTTECGGDWWYYYQRENRLYILVADATGHGIPAALITAAARSVFANLRDQDATLPQMAESWDKSVSECSNGKVFMTAFLLEIDVEFGHCQAINAGHEPPAILRNKNGKFEANYLMTERNFAIGERKGKWRVDKFDLEPGDRIVIITDGLLAIRGPDGRGYSEKRFLKYLEKTCASSPDPVRFGDSIQADFLALGGDQPLPDDVTVVVADFKA